MYKLLSVALGTRYKALQAEDIHSGHTSPSVVQAPRPKAVPSHPHVETSFSCVHDHILSEIMQSLSLQLQLMFGKYRRLTIKLRPLCAALSSSLLISFNNQ